MSELPPVTGQPTSLSPGAQPDDVASDMAAPPPSTAGMLGLAFGASAGLMTALYLVFFF
jgi:hypothetical protein